ncbi:carbohydrate ABC transporter permease [Anaeromassilibacillus sp. SJQ-5]|jgi:ABC transporter, permease protein
MANRSRGGDVVNFLFLCAVGVFMALPLVYVIVNAFKPLDEIFMFPPRFFVRNPTMNNFSELYIVLADSWVPFSRYVFNTLFITATGTLFHVLFASMAAFALCKIDLPGKNLLFFIVVNSLMFTPAVTGVPNYMIMTNLRLTDTYWSIILPVVGGSMGLFLMKQFMSTVPDALIEAAKIDGAHQMTIFWRVVMPQVKPAWLTLVIFCVQNLWNANGGVYIYTEHMKTLPYALSQIVGGGIARTGVASTVSLIMLVVPVCTFILTQSNIVETMASSGIKE